MNKVCFYNNTIKGMSGHNHMLTMKATEKKQNSFLILHLLYFLIKVSLSYIKFLYVVEEYFFKF